MSEEERRRAVADVLRLVDQVLAGDQAGSLLLEIRKGRVVSTAFLPWRMPP